MNDELPPSAEPLIESVRTLQATLNEEQRCKLWRQIMDDYCEHCGCVMPDYGCYCMRDD